MSKVLIRSMNGRLPGRPVSACAVAPNSHARVRGSSRVSLLRGIDTISVTFQTIFTAGEEWPLRQSPRTRLHRRQDRSNWRPSDT